MKIEAIFDASAAAAPSWYETAVNKVFAVMGAMFSNKITITLDVGWGEENGNTIGGDDGAQSQSLGYEETYAELKSALASAPAQVARAAAKLMPAADPTSGGEFFVPVAMEKALGQMSGSTTEVDGYVGVNAGLDWSTDQAAVQPGQNDIIGALEHETAEVMGRIGAVGYAQGPGVYAPMDLYRYSAPGQRDMTAGAGDFSVDGTSMLQAFNDPKDGGDVADWLPSIQGDAFGDTYQGVAGRLTSVDLTAMSALGYRKAAKASTAPVDLASANTISSAVGFATHGRLTLSGTAAEAGATIELTAGRRDLGETTADSQGFWSLQAGLVKGNQGPIRAVVTGSEGDVSTVRAGFEITAGIVGQPYSIDEEVHGRDGQTTSQTLAEADGTLYLTDTMTHEADGTTIVNASGGSYFSGKSYSEEITTLDQAGTVTSDATYGDFGAVTGAGGASARGDSGLVYGEGKKDFVFGAHPGEAVVSGFAVSGDTHSTLTLPASDFASLAAVIRATHMVGGNAVITLDQSDSITLVGVTMAQLKARPADFKLQP